MTAPADHPLRRALRDAHDRVVGTLSMAINHDEPGLLHAAVIRSVVPHGTIREIDRDEALDADGVVAVITGHDLELMGLDPWFGGQRKDQPVLAIDKVRYAGEPVVLVVAETARQAADAAHLVFIDYDELPNTTDEVEAGQPGAPQLHEEWPGNACGDWQLHHGDVDAAVAGAHLVVSGTYVTPTASHVPMEPHVAVARYDHDAPSLEVLSSSQSPHMAAISLKSIFGIEDVAVRVQNLGGGYGAKGQTKIEPLAACAAYIAGAPVKLVLDREGVFATVGRHAATCHITTAVDVDGRVVARDIDVTYNAGAYCVTTAGATGQGLVRAPGPYATPNVRVRSRGRYTNSVPTGPFRGAMTGQVCLAYEAQLDEVADRLGIDRLEIRRRNVLRDGDTYATGEVLHDMNYDALLDRTAAAIGWDDPPTAPDGPRRRGKGLGIMIKSTLTPSRSEALVDVDDHGVVTLHTASVEMGQGASATLLLLLGTAMGIDPDDIRLPSPGTDHAPFDTTTASSRTTYSMGNAVQDAARDLMGQLDALACGGQPPPEPLPHRDGSVITPDGPRRYADLVADGTTLVGHGVWASTGGIADADPMDVKGWVTPHWHQGAAAVEVEVDVETGRVSIVQAVGGSYVGRAISPTRVDQQNVGCVVLGLGPALFEELVYDDGQNTNPNLSDYMIPSILDVPAQVGSIVVEHPDPDAELHGVGEMAMPPVAPAVVSAIHDATGVWLRDLPLTPERVLRALEDAGVTTHEEASR